MNSQGYTRRDHNQRKRRARRGNEPVLDKLLKIFFYILVALVAIILVKIIFFGNKKENSENWTEKIALHEALKNVPEREMEVVRLRYFDGKTQIEISKIVGISQAQVSRLEKSAIKRIKSCMN